MFGPVKSEWRKSLKMYQIHTRASIVTKDFPSLLAELCKKSFLPSHFKSGFRRCGIHPLNRDAIPSSKFSKALSFTGKSIDQEDETGNGKQTILIKFHITLHRCCSLCIALEWYSYL